MDPVTLALIQFAIKFGIDAAITLATTIQNGGATISDAINALEMAKTKTAATYLADDAALSAVSTIPLA